MASGTRRRMRSAGMTMCWSSPEQAGRVRAPAAKCFNITEPESLTSRLIISPPQGPAYTEPPSLKRNDSSRDMRHRSTRRNPALKRSLTGLQGLAPPQGRRRSGRAGSGLASSPAFFVGLGGYWIFQEIQLLQIVQPKGGIRLLTSPGLPAIVYAVLWAFGTLIAAFAEDVGTA